MVVFSVVYALVVHSCVAWFVRLHYVLFVVYGGVDFVWWVLGGMAVGLLVWVL